MAIDDLDRRFDYYPPRDERTVWAYEVVRAACLDVACTFNVLLPDGREKSAAVAKLEEAMMWGSAAIARNGGPAA